MSHTCHFAHSIMPSGQALKPRAMHKCLHGHCSCLTTGMLHAPQDRNPAALEHLGVLMEDTYGSLQDQGTEMEKAKNKQVAAARTLSAAVFLLQQLIICRFNLTGAEQEVLRTHLSAEVRQLICSLPHVAALLLLYYAAHWTGAGVRLQLFANSQKQAQVALFGCPLQTPDVL
jgi:hypothetical protein